MVFLFLEEDKWVCCGGVSEFFKSSLWLVLKVSLKMGYNGCVTKLKDENKLSFFCENVDL